MIGETVSHYKVVEKLGEGGMGIVYKAQDTKLDRFVALKFLPSHMCRDEVLKRRFIQEAKAASTLDHPNICAIYEIDETTAEMEELSAGQLFIAMAYYDGQTLRDKILEEKPISIAQTINIISQIAQGLNKAHERGIVHRDIKPANIMITEEGEIKILDFGLAKLRGQTILTKEESTIGTIAYMSPEQASGTEVDSRSDIWSLGVVFYEMLTGKLPFEANYEQAIIYNILNTTPEPITNLNKEVPPELNDVVKKCLVKEKEDRLQTIKEFYSALVQIIKKYNYTIRATTHDLPTVEPPQKKTILKFAISVIVILIIVLGFLIYRMIFTWESKYSSYEEAFFEKRYDKSRDISKNDRSLDNVKAHRYFLLATALTNNNTIPTKIKQEYRDLLFQHPKLPESYYYLGLIHALSAQTLSERDSVWLLYDQAVTPGVSNIYLALDKFIFYKRNSFVQETFKFVDRLLDEDSDDPNVMYEIGDFFHHKLSDTSRSREYYEKTLHLYDKHVPAILGLCQLSLANNDFNSATMFLEKAAEINREDYNVVKERVHLYVREGRYDDAENCLKAALDSYGKNDARYYETLADLYLKLDLFEKCVKTIEDASQKFNNETYFAVLKNHMNERKQWLQTLEKQKKNKNIIIWAENYEEALKKSASAKKPVLIEFYSTNNSLSKIFQEKIYPDPLIQEVLKSFIPLRINSELKKDLANRYKIFLEPALVIIKEDGKKLGPVRYFPDPTESKDFIPDLQDGLALYKKYAEGAAVDDQHITEVSNIEDAVLLSKSKQVPVMAVFLSKASKWSEKLLMETINNPVLQTELKNVILVRVDQTANTNVIRKWDIKYFPSIIFLNENREIIFQVQGFQPPNILAELISDVNDAMIDKRTFKDRIMWLYDLEEAKAFAESQRKDIFIFGDADWCPYCKRTRDYIFTDPNFINTMNSKYISVVFRDGQDDVLLKSFGITGFPTFLLLAPSQEEIIRLVGYQDKPTLLAQLNLDERKPLYSIMGQEKYREFYWLESISVQLYGKKYYRSVIQAMLSQIEIYPDYWRSYIIIGDAYRRLKKPEESVAYYSQAIDKGASINSSFAENILNTFLQMNNPSGFEKWFQETLKIRSQDEHETAVLYTICSEFYEILKDRRKALAMSENSVKIKPDYFEGLIQLGRLYYLENRFEEANRYLTKAAQSDKSKPIPYLYLGLIADRKGDVKEKERYYKQMGKKSVYLVNDVGGRIYYQYRPGYYVYEGYIDLIEQDYRNLIQVDAMPGQSLKNDFAFFLAINNRNLGDALKLVEEALEEEHSNPKILTTKAVILFQQGKYQKAQEIIRLVEHRLASDDLKKDPTVSYYIGRIYWAVGDTVSAKKYFNFALEQTEPDANGERYQQELKRFLAENN